MNNNDGEPANLPSGILALMVSATDASDHTQRPISVETTVGLIAFTLIYKHIQTQTDTQDRYMHIHRQTQEHTHNGA